MTVSEQIVLSIISMFGVNFFAKLIEAYRTRRKALDEHEIQKDSNNELFKAQYIEELKKELASYKAKCEVLQEKYDESKEEIVALKLGINNKTQ